MEEQDEIVVFQHFESPIEANIIKTKLDAYGIPCFLTEENLANLIPLQNFPAMGVRLHLFAKDVAWAKSVLIQNNLSVNDESKCDE